MDHAFTEIIKQKLKEHFGEYSDDIFDRSELLKYINQKTRSANKGSKARGSFANLYAIYVLIEDYINKGFSTGKDYSDYEGALFSPLFKRQRELPFGSKLQNHGINGRMNDEFRKFFPTSEYTPILRKDQRYWINDNLLKITIGTEPYNLATSIIEVIDEYIKAKQNSFDTFITTIQELKQIEKSEPVKVIEFIDGLLAPNSDARLFEITSYSILKYHYFDQSIYWGYELDNLTNEQLKLFKTGRTNANDGGIDFVMKPLGRFFQVTETLDFKKYFLDIDKIQKFPITFIIKSSDPVKDIIDKIEANAQKAYSVKAIVQRYMDCIEEVINITILKDLFQQSIKQGYLSNVLDEIILQSKVEFNYEEDEPDDQADDLVPVVEDL